MCLFCESVCNELIDLLFDFDYECLTSLNTHMKFKSDRNLYSIEQIVSSYLSIVFRGVFCVRIRCKDSSQAECKRWGHPGDVHGAIPGEVEYDAARHKDGKDYARRGTGDRVYSLGGNGGNAKLQILSTGPGSELLLGESGCRQNSSTSHQMFTTYEAYSSSTCILAGKKTQERAGGSPG